ncbi:ribulose-phosphate 3-epimerase [Candidatus Peregrinibacteria bacterium]|nr:ribulose-phosphate 3-epimerase [Candidatus Peregrinibacteria bacterium]
MVRQAHHDRILIAPSILSSDFGRINEEIKAIEPHCDLVHIDVMDGHFVPNLTFGAPVVAKMKCGRPMDVHLMIENPEKYIEDFASAISKAHGKKDDCYITVHQETCPHLHRTIQQIKNTGCKAAVAINPATPIYALEPVLADLDMVLCMTVNPGFGGQEFIESVLPKFKELRRRAPNLNLEVDGGINEKTVKLAVKAGANVIVAGSYIFGAKDRVKAIESLR